MSNSNSNACSACGPVITSNIRFATDIYLHLDASDPEKDFLTFLTAAPIPSRSRDQNQTSTTTTTSTSTSTSTSTKTESKPESKPEIVTEWSIPLFQLWLTAPQNRAYVEGHDYERVLLGMRKERVKVESVRYRVGLRKGECIMRR